MTNHPNRSRPNLMFIEDGYATITTTDDWDNLYEITTTHLGEGRYVRIDDGQNYPQLCEGVNRLGNTLIYHTDEQLARECRARLFKTRKRYEAAKSRAGFVSPEDEAAEMDALNAAARKKFEEEDAAFHARFGHRV